MEKGVRVAHRLTFVDKMRLVEWTKEYLEQILEEKWDKGKVAEEASRALDFIVKPSNLNLVAEVLHIRWPRKGAGTYVAPSRYVDKDFEELVKALDMFLHEYGVPVGTGFNDLVRKVNRCEDTMKEA